MSGQAGRQRHGVREPGGWGSLHMPFRVAGWTQRGCSLGHPEMPFGLPVGLPRALSAGQHSGRQPRVCAWPRLQLSWGAAGGSVGGAAG